MNSFDVASRFFHACESLEGWAGCQQYVADGAAFTAQSEPLVDVLRGNSASFVSSLALSVLA